MPKTFPWEPLDKSQQIWTAKYRLQNFIARSLAFLARDRQLLLVSPGAPLEEGFPQALREAGNPRQALIPNAFHFLGYLKFKKKYPNLTGVASAKAQRRLTRKGVREIQNLEYFAKKLPENITLLEPEGMGFGEVWLRVEDGGQITWVVCDAFFNYARFSHKPIARTIQRLVKAAPGLQTSSVVKYFLIRDRKRYKQWLLAQLEKDRPTTLVPQHGEILHAEDLPQQIQKLCLRRL